MKGLEQVVFVTEHVCLLFRAVRVGPNSEIRTGLLGDGVFMSQYVDLSYSQLFSQSVLLSYDCQLDSWVCVCVCTPGMSCKGGLPVSGVKADSGALPGYSNAWPHPQFSCCMLEFTQRKSILSPSVGFFAHVHPRPGANAVLC